MLIVDSKCIGYELYSYSKPYLDYVVESREIESRSSSSSD